MATDSRQKRAEEEIRKAGESGDLALSLRGMELTLLPESLREFGQDLRGRFLRSCPPSRRLRRSTTSLSTMAPTSASLKNCRSICNLIVEKSLNWRRFLPR
jgi:hypothetical protein